MIIAFISKLVAIAILSTSMASVPVQSQHFCAKEGENPETYLCVTQTHHTPHLDLPFSVWCLCEMIDRGAGRLWCLCRVHCDCPVEHRD